MKLTTPIEYVYTTTHSAADAYERVLSFAGASLHRDALDEVIVKDTRNGDITYGKDKKGLIDSQDECGGWPVLNSEATPADTDGDGIPDAWEDANGLDKNNAADGKTVGADGYTNLEKYMNSLVAHIMEGGNEGGTMLNGRQIFGDPTGISDITVAPKKDNRTYNLQGIEVQNPTKRGIYIRNGKKIVINK